MRFSIRLIILAGLLYIITACATIGGTLVGAGIGAIGGNARMGAAVGMTSGAVVDIFGRRR